MKKYIGIFILLYFISIGKIGAYISFNIGEKVTYKGIDYYVIKNSSQDDSTVTLLKKYPLSYEEVLAYSESIGIDVGNESGYGKVRYHSSNSDYSTSYVKQVVDAWASSKLNNQDLVVDSTGYGVRLLSHDDLVTNLGYINSKDTGLPPSSNGATPLWVYNNAYSSWTMSPYSDSNSTVWNINADGSLGVSYVPDVYFHSTIRPVITLKKEAIDYYKDMYEYNNIRFYIVDNDIKSDYVTLLKAEPVTSNEIKDYLSSTEVANKVVTSDEYGTSDEYISMAYYARDNCVSAGDMSGCSTDYNLSDIKQVVDIWASHYIKSEDLKEARLLNEEDLFSKLGYDWNITSEGVGENPIVNDNVPTWVYNSNYIYWTMMQKMDYSKLFYISSNGTLNSDMTSTFNVRPVVVLKRSALGDLDEIIDDINDTDKVNVPDTNMTLSIIIIVFGFIIACSSMVIYYIILKKKGK